MNGWNIPAIVSFDTIRMGGGGDVLCTSRMNFDPRRNFKLQRKFRGLGQKGLKIVMRERFTWYEIRSWEFAFFVQEEFLQSRVEGNSFCPIPSIDAFFSFSFPIRRNEKNFRILRIVPWFLPPAIVISFKSILRFHRRLTRTRNIHAKIPLIRYFRVSPCRRWLMRKNIK